MRAVSDSYRAGLPSDGFGARRMTAVGRSAIAETGQKCLLAVGRRESSTSVMVNGSNHKKEASHAKAKLSI